MQNNKTITNIVTTVFILIGTGFIFAVAFIVVTNISRDCIMPGVTAIGAFELLLNARGPQVICDFVSC